ncbi:hypothetical protein K490DRAFT_56699 [Saccharata proteae CBS 121410]|uniref:Uncharacterized protein n=1 Tax=Saccharata proteae CBS 121410 TaxID=1314787 RepID=A0A9P4LXG0_9PEZI|nr:hypothetical protein K490DRAFT_56699 [Saccharata proteae CBS 121410]
MSLRLCKRAIRRCVSTIRRDSASKIEPEKARGTVFLDPLNPKGADLLRHYEHNYYTPAATPPEPAQETADAPIQPSDAVKQLDRSITPEALSNYLLWQLYYDYCEPPPTEATKWYSNWDTNDLTVFIEMGLYFRHGHTTVGGGMERACAELGISWLKDVAWRIVRLASSHNMEQSELANIVENAREDSSEDLVRATSLLNILNHNIEVITLLTPAPSSIHARMRTNLIKVLEDYVRFVIQPQITRAKGDWLASVPETESDRIIAQRVNKRYLTVQLPREVPLYPYGKDHHLSRLNPERGQGVKLSNSFSNPELYHPAGHYGNPGMPTPPSSRGRNEHPSLVARVGALPEVPSSDLLSPLLPLIDSARPSSPSNSGSKPDSRSNTTSSRISMSSREWIAKEQQTPAATKNSLRRILSLDGINADREALARQKMLQAENDKLKAETSRLERQLEEVRLRKAAIGANATAPAVERSKPAARTSKPDLRVKTDVSPGPAAVATGNSRGGYSSQDVSPTTVGAQQSPPRAVDASQRRTNRNRLTSTPDISALGRKNQHHGHQLHQSQRQQPRRHVSTPNINNQYSPETPISGAPPLPQHPPQYFNNFGFPPPQMPPTPPLFFAPSYSRDTLPSQVMFQQQVPYSTMLTPIGGMPTYAPNMLMQHPPLQQQQQMLYGQPQMVGSWGVPGQGFQQQTQTQQQQRPVSSRRAHTDSMAVAAQRSSTMASAGIGRKPSREMGVLGQAHGRKDSQAVASGAGMGKEQQKHRQRYH